MRIGGYKGGFRKILIGAAKSFGLDSHQIKVYLCGDYSLIKMYKSKL